jgi:ERCC4-type nuclease
MTPERRLRILLEDATTTRILEQHAYRQYLSAKDMYDFTKKEWNRLELLSVRTATELKEFQRKHPDVKPEVLV